MTSVAESPTTTSKAMLVGKWATSAVLVAGIVTLSMSRSFYESSMVSAFLSLAIASVLVILLMLRRSWLDILLVVAGAALLALVDLRIMHFHYFFMAGFSFVGM